MTSDKQTKDASPDDKRRVLALLSYLEKASELIICVCGLADLIDAENKGGNRNVTEKAHTILDILYVDPVDLLKILDINTGDLLNKVDVSTGYVKGEKALLRRLGKASYLLAALMLEESEDTDIKLFNEGIELTIREVEKGMWKWWEDVGPPGLRIDFLIEDAGEEIEEALIQVAEAFYNANPDTTEFSNLFATGGPAQVERVETSHSVRVAIDERDDGSHIELMADRGDGKGFILVARAHPYTPDDYRRIQDFYETIETKFPGSLERGGVAPKKCTEPGPLGKPADLYISNSAESGVI